MADAKTPTVRALPALPTRIETDDRVGRRGRGPARQMLALLALAALLALTPLSALAAGATANGAPGPDGPAPTQSAFTTLEGAGADRDLGTTNPKDYMNVSLTLTQQTFVRVSFTGYAFAKSSAAGAITPGCPCLVRGELRVNEEPRQIVTRTVLATDANDIVGDPSASPAVAAADRRDFSGSQVYSLAPGTYTFTMSLAREVGTAQNVGFGFGRMQAEVLSGATQEAFATLDGAGADRDLGATNPKDYMTVKLDVPKQALVRVNFTGYAFAKASGGGVQTPGCPCLVRGELRVNQEAKQIVTRTVLATDGNDIVADPNATPAVAAADRRDFSGSHVYSLAPGSYTFTMSLAREVGTAQNVGFAFGRMQAEILSGLPESAVTTLEGAGADRDLNGAAKDYMSVTLAVPQASQVRVSFTGYAFAKSGGAGTITPGCPCLVRGEMRANQDARQIVTRTVLATDGDDVVGDPNASPAVAAADRRDFSGSHVFDLPAGTYTFTMSMAREVGTADNVGFAFGRMQAQLFPANAPAPMPGMPNTGAGGAAVADDLSWRTLAPLGLVAAIVAGLGLAARRRLA